MLILALYRSGRQTDALETYRRGGRRLDDELGLEPSPALQRLQQLILRQASELEQPGSSVVAAKPAVPRPTPAPGRGSLIGRARERAALDDALGRLGDGHGGLVLIAGEAGVGKTRFVEDVLGEAGTFVRGDAPEQAPPPYGPIAAALRAAARVDPGALDDCGPSAPFLGVLLPERGAPPPGDRATVFEAIRCAFRAIARRGPAIVFLDDLHWADATTCELLPSLAAAMSEEPLLLVGAYRSDEITRGHPLRRMRAELRRAGRLDELALEPLDREETAALSARALGGAPSATLARTLYDRTQGVPFFIEELCAALVTGRRVTATPGGLELAGGDELPVPDTLRDAVLARADALSAEARSVLEAACVAGLRFELARRRRAGRRGRDRRSGGERHPRRGGAGCRRLPPQPHPRGVLPRHPLGPAPCPASPARGAADGARRSARAARGALGGGARARSGTPGLPRRRARVPGRPRLSRRARLVPAGSGAVAARRRARPAGAARAARPVRRAQRRADDRGLVLGGGRRGAAGRGRPPTPWRTWSGGSPWSTSCRRCPSAPSGRESARPRRSAGPATTPARPPSSSRAWPSSRRWAGSRPRSRWWRGRLRTRSRRSGAISWRAGWASRAACAPSSATSTRASAWHATASRSPSPTTSRRRRPSCTSGSRRCSRTPRTSAARSRSTARPTSSASPTARPPPGRSASCASPTCVWQTGRWDEAEKLERRIIADPQSPPGVLAAARAALGIFSAARGRIKGTRRLLVEGLSYAQRHQRLRFELNTLTGLAWLEELEHDRAAAADRYREIVTRCAQTEDLHYAPMALRSAVTFFGLQGEMADARSCAAALADMAAATTNRETLAALAHALGEIALLERGPDDAVVEFSRALDLLRELDLPYQRAHTQLRAASAFAAAGSRDAAVERLTDAYRSARKLGAQPLAAIAAAELERLGERAEERLGRRAAGELERGGLSRRELQVLRLVSVGRTNREIARELYLSQRTVDMHVRNILAKLDCRSRLEAVKRGGELGLVA